MSDLLSTFWMVRRHGTGGASDWEVITDREDADRYRDLGVHFEVKECHAPPPGQPPTFMDVLAAEIHKRGREKGFWDREKIDLPDDPTEPRFAPARQVSNPSVIPEKLALVHSEISEALDALRDEDFEHVGEELADVLIRTLDIAAFCGLSMDEAVAAKMAKNLGRPPLNGRAW